MRNIDTYSAQHEQSALQTNKLIRNTYMLLGMTLVMSAITAGISVMMEPPAIISLGSLAVSIVMVIVLSKKQNSPAALPLVFLFTGLMGFCLGPILNRYLGMANGGEIVATALGMTALTVFGLSAYVLTTKKDFSFMGGFLAAGMIVALIAILAMVAMPFFGVDVSGFRVAISSMVVLLMCGFILYDTSNIVNGVYSNYVMATVSIYMNIYNLFVNILYLVGILNDD